MAISPETSSNPMVRGFENTLNTIKITVAIFASSFKTAENYWKEIACLESQSKSSSKLEDRLLPYAQRIIRDSVSAMALDSYRERGDTLLQFLEVIKLPAAYQFLLNEIKKYADGSNIYYNSGLIFEIGFAIKKHYGIDSEIYKNGLPKIVQQIIAGKPFQLKNNFTMKHLTFKEVDEGLTLQTTEKLDGKKSTWMAEPFYLDTDEGLYGSGRKQSNLYFKIKTMEASYMKYVHPKEKSTTKKPDNFRDRFYDREGLDNMSEEDADLFRIKFESDNMISIAKKVTYFSRTIVEAEDGEIQVDSPSYYRQGTDPFSIWVVSLA